VTIEKTKYMNMNSRLEQFVRDNREEFDADEPGKKVWENIQSRIEPGKKKTAAIFGLNRTWWSAAAAVILIIAGGIWYISRSRTGQMESNIASQGHPSKAQQPIDTATKNPAIIAQQNNTVQATQDSSSLATTTPKDDVAGNESESVVNEEMYHYAKLVELKHKELKTIEKDEPLLYKQFASDVNKLDSVYRTLEQQLPKNLNREQLLEAMLQNLQLQMGLLNHQLDIIKQINHSKKAAYEKAYKTM
jgi:hypothetical protein